MGKGKPNTKVILDNLYFQLKDHIHLVTQIMPPSVEIVYEVDGNLVRQLEETNKDVIIKYFKKNKAAMSKFKSLLRTDEFAPVAARFDEQAIAEQLYRRFRMDNSKELSGTPQTFSWGDVPAFCVMDPELLKEGPFDAWTEFTSRLDFPDVFMAFVWSIFDPKNNGRQALWIKGEGQDGKSSVVDALSSFMGNEAVAAMKKEDSNDKFFAGAFENKRLAVHGECSNSNLLSTSIIKSLVSGEYVGIEHKHQRKYTNRIYCKLIIMSNIYPEINTDDRSELSRLLFVNVLRPPNNMGDPNFFERLRSQIPAFLVECRKKYDELCPTRSNIIVPPDMLENILSTCISRDTDLVENFIEHRIRFGQDYFTIAQDLNNAFQVYASKNWRSDRDSFTVSRLKKQLQLRGAKFIRTSVDGTRVRGYKGIKVVLE
jgi:hypothetical protein